MRITPLDVRKQEFGKSMRGFDCDEVRAFLNTLADEYEAVLMDSKQIRERTLEMEDKLGEYQRMEKNLRDTLLTAERLTQETRETATREGELIIRDAEMKARGVLEECRLRTEELRREITGLRKEKETYLARFRSLAEAQIQFIDTHRTDFEDLDRRLTDIVDSVVTRTGTAAPGGRYEAPSAPRAAAPQTRTNPYVQAPSAPYASARAQAPEVATPYVAPSFRTAPAPFAAAPVPPAPVAPAPATSNDIWRDYIPGRNAAAVAGAPVQHPTPASVNPGSANRNHQGFPSAADREEDLNGVIAQTLAELPDTDESGAQDERADKEDSWRPEPVVTEVTNL